jgi:hypothetical protein
MLFEEFIRRSTQPTPDELLQLVVDSIASGQEAALKAVCERFGDMIVTHMESWRALPENIQDDPERTGQYVRCLVITAQCMASLGRTECLRALTESPEGES